MKLKQALFPSPASLRHRLLPRRGPRATALRTRRTSYGGHPGADRRTDARDEKRAFYALLIPCAIALISQFALAASAKLTPAQQRAKLTAAAEAWARAKTQAAARRGVPPAPVRGVAAAPQGPVPARIGAPLQARIENACSDSESWAFSPRASAAWTERIQSIGHGGEHAYQALILGHLLKFGQPDAEAKSVGEYLVYRGFLELGVVHLAHRGFTSMLLGLRGPDAAPMQLVALECLTRIRSKYPSMELPQGAAAALEVTPARLTEKQRTVLYEAMYNVAAWKISDKGVRADLTREHEFLRGSGPYETLLLANEYAIRQDLARAIPLHEKFLKEGSLPDALEKQRDGIRANLARLYYQAGKIEKASELFGTVSQRNNLFSQALNDRAWTHLQLNQHAQAASLAINLMTGELRNTFNPAAPVIAAISYFENCQYREAKQAIALFKQVYGGSYRWLYQWYQAHRQTPLNLYPMLAKFVETKKGAPRNIASEWLRSPVFVSEQQEVNLILDEKALLPKLIQEFAQHPQFNPRQPASALALFRVWLQGFWQEIPRVEATLVARINKELAFRNRVMIAQFVEAMENVQLLEIELATAAGDRMLAKVSDEDKAKMLERARAEAKAKDSARTGSTLDWGRFPSGEFGQEPAEESESWEDELGAIRAEVLNLCRRTGKEK